MRVLVPMDGSEQSWEAFEYAAERFPEDTLVCLRVVDPAQGAHGAGMGIDTPANDLLEAGQEAAEEMFEEVHDRAAAVGVDVETEMAVGRPARTIEEYADQEDVDHVVVGSHGRDGIVRILLAASPRPSSGARPCR